MRLRIIEAARRERAKGKRVKTGNSELWKIRDGVRMKKGISGKRKRRIKEKSIREK